jgi:uncharacterized membrane protein
LASAASTVQDQFVRGRVVRVVEEHVRDIAGIEHVVADLEVRIAAGGGRGQTVRASYVVAVPGQEPVRIHPGDGVVLVRSLDPSAGGYEVVDRDRLPALAVGFLVFLAVALATSRFRGVTAVLGLGISLLVLARFVVPQIVAGANPLAVTLLGAVAIALVSIYLAHGMSRRTTVALAGTLLTLGIAAASAIAFVAMARLSGAGSEEAIYLQIGYLETVNLRGLLLGGILLGALGVLDDITTAQAAAVEEISRANPALTASELYRRGLSVGREHIVGLINTLVLAYAGASLPLFVLFTLNPDQPLWITLNSEFVAEEIVRTLVGSLALILAVPITTFLAARFLRNPGPTRGGHQHHHLHGHAVSHVKEV